MNDKVTEPENRRRIADEEIEFMEAMERYCREHRRSFPSWSEVLEVLRALGYSKKPAGKDAEANGTLEKLCAELKEERDRLQLQAAKLQDQRDQCRKAVLALMPDVDLEINEEELLAQAGKGQSLEEFMAELEAELIAPEAVITASPKESP